MLYAAHDDLINLININLINLINLVNPRHTRQTVSSIRKNRTWQPISANSPVSPADRDLKVMPGFESTRARA